MADLKAAQPQMGDSSFEPRADVKDRAATSSQAVEIASSREKHGSYDQNPGSNMSNDEIVEDTQLP
jgi:hypothetical protein